MNAPARWTAGSFSWRFEVEDERLTFELSGVQPVHFDSKRIRTVNWLTKKHENGAMHEPNFAFVLARLIELLDPDVYFDIGGYIGYFTVLPMAWTRTSTRIVSFEMHPGYAKQIMHNVDQNRHLSSSRVFVINAGIGAEVQLARTTMVDAFTLDSDYAGAEELVIDHLTLDHVASQLDLRPDLVKMDIEGFEAAALHGAADVLETVRPVWLFELHSDELLGRHGESRASMLELMERHGYDVLELTGDRFDSVHAGPPLRPLDDASRAAILRRFNSALVAVPHERRAELAPLVDQ